MARGRGGRGGRGGAQQIPDLGSDSESSSDDSSLEEGSRFEPEVEEEILLRSAASGNAEDFAKLTSRTPDDALFSALYKMTECPSFGDTATVLQKNFATSLKTKQKTCPLDWLFQVLISALTYVFTFFSRKQSGIPPIREHVD